MYNNGNSSKNVTGSSVVDGTMESADYADNGLSGDKIDGGIISNFQSTGIDDRSSTAKNITLTDSNTTFSGDIKVDNGAVSSVVSTGTAAGVVQISGGGTVIGTSSFDLIQNGVGSHVWARNSEPLMFATGGTERMRIDSSGNVLIGTTTTYGKLTSTSTSNGTFGSASVGTDYAKSSRVTSGAGYADFFYTGTGSTYAGYIYANGGTTTYATTSDYRLKENVVPMTGSIDRLKDLKPSKFNFIGEDKTVDGFLAHEAQSVVPECVHGTKDAMKDEEYEVTPAVMDGETVVTEAVMGTRTVPDYQGIDQSKLVPLLVASLQEAIARIEILENA